MPNTSKATRYVAIETRRLILRTPTLSDAPAYAALFSNPLNYEHEPHKPSNPSVEHYERVLSSFIEGTHKRKSAVLTICLKDGEEIIGTGGFNSIFTRQPGNVRIGDAGIMIDSAHWRKGYAKEAVAAMLDWAFIPSSLARRGQPAIDVVVFESLAANDRIKGLLSGCFGFQATLRDGGFGAEQVWEITRADWLKRSTMMGLPDGDIPFPASLRPDP